MCREKDTMKFIFDMIEINREPLNTILHPNFKIFNFNFNFNFNF